MKQKTTNLNRFINRYKEYKESRKLISYDAMRRSIGILGMALPFALIIGTAVFYNCFRIQNSISLYYYTGMRDLLVGTLAFVSLFLFAYRGYTVFDRISGILAGVGAIGVALFPTVLDQVVAPCTSQCYPSSEWKSVVHLSSAALFFIVLALTSLFLFTRTKEGKEDLKTKQKIIRNKLYRACGIIMLVSLVFIFVYMKFLKGKYPLIDEMKPIFWLETIALLAFGTSWLVKGKGFLRDKKTKQ